ncbi:hypothetical protein E2C01_008117 [Portunus trituberculatus]|uniref:Uncharacterized protein n=1 Tax=Portunus trituberculatus TaxID=210409 RepID=A0A5B7D0X4_PORTR|nr:hypothetical protein [Portunus trituberculatus]
MWKKLVLVPEHQSFEMRLKIVDDPSTHLIQHCQSLITYNLSQSATRERELSGGTAAQQQAAWAWASVSPTM